MIKGFKFGLMLQLSIGPVFILIMNTAIKNGFRSAFMGVIAVTLVDAFYILLAIIGLKGLSKRIVQYEKPLNLFSGLVIFLFGLNTLLSIFGLQVIPVFNLGQNHIEHIFIKAMLLTITNPLTIIFWFGILSTKLTLGGIQKNTVYSFALGAIASSFSFLTFVSLLGNQLSVFISPRGMAILNGLVGLILIGLAFKVLLNKDSLEYQQ